VTSLRTSALPGHDMGENAMTTLFGPRGETIDLAKRVKKPLVGELVAGWGGNAPFVVPDLARRLNLQFDTSKLDLADYRIMREHPQIASSLAILSFMMYQRDWRLVGGKQRVRAHCEANLRDIWPRVIRSMSTAFWSGYSPNALQWENDIPTGRLVVTKIKDLRPETSRIRWKSVPGVASKKTISGVTSKSVPNKIKIFDGITQLGSVNDVEVENSFWYPLLMSEGNHYGTKLFNAVFQPWYFSLLLHLYANRYFERFAEPVPVGRAPYDDTITIGGMDIPGNQAMQAIIGRIASGSGAVLPNSRTADGYQGDSTYDYTLDYLESNLRGVDYERYLMRLDDEISMGLFTPLLMFRQADVGSSNLGVVHTQTYMTMLNAIAGDWQEYINRYLVSAMARQNFGFNVEAPKIEFRPLGKLDGETMRALLQMLIGGGKAKILDLDTLGAAAGLELQEIRQVLPEGNDTPVGEDGQKKDDRVGRPGKNKTPTGTDKVSQVANGISDRLIRQAARGAGDFTPDLGYRRQVVGLFEDEWEGGRFYTTLCDTVEEFAGAVSREEFEGRIGTLVAGALGCVP
jgi:hypothetical protein